MRTTREFYAELAEIGRREVIASAGIMLGRYNNHDAGMFYWDVEEMGLDAAIREHQIECTEDYETMLNAVNDELDDETIEDIACDITNDAHDDELREMRAKAKSEGWSDGDELLARIKINNRYKKIRAQEEQRIRDGLVKRFIRNCGDHTPREEAVLKVKAEVQLERETELNSFIAEINARDMDEDIRAEIRRDMVRELNKAFDEMEAERIASLPHGEVIELDNALDAECAAG